MTILMFVLAGLIPVIAGVVFVLTKNMVSQGQVGAAKAEADRVLKEAKLRADTVLREADLKNQEQTFQTRQKIDEEIKNRRQEILQIENRLNVRDQNLSNKEESIKQTEINLKDKQESLDRQKEKLEALYKEQSIVLEKVAGMDKEEARKSFLTRVEQDCKAEAANIISTIEDQANKIAKQKAKNIVALAIHRTAVDHTLDTTTSVVVLPSEEFKGKIIGKEGRNIRAFEHMTGMDIIVDDTPEAVIISGFDPIRREIAKRSLQALLSDGRIHPARIEEAVNRSRRDVKQFIKEKGEEICTELQVHHVHPKIQELLGRLFFRTSYGQNNWYHAIEVARLASQMAQELGVNEVLAKRAALMHDIGKSIDFEQEGTHPQLGAEFAKKHGESAEVVHAILAHHEDVQPATVEAILVLVADAISAARPGARSESRENYAKRLTKLEEIANSFEGVEKAFALQAGREIRIMVRPDEVDDAASVKIAHDVAKRVENEMEYPGQVKVMVIRETRAVDVAK